MPGDLNILVRILHAREDDSMLFSDPDVLDHLPEVALDFNLKIPLEDALDILVTHVRNELSHAQAPFMIGGLTCRYPVGRLRPDGVERMVRRRTRAR